MKIELKNVKHSEFASQETECFSATLYIDGKKVGTVSNDGHGGCNLYHPWEIKQTIDAYAATLPPTVFDDIELQPNADILVDEVLGDYLRRRDHQKLCRNRTVFRIPGHAYKRNQWHTHSQPFDATVKLFLVGRYGAETLFLNEHIGERFDAAH